MQIFIKYFFSSGSSKIFAAVYLRICSTGPLIFPHPSASLLECQLILLKKSSTTEMGFNSYPNISRKWNWFQIFLSEMHLSQKNGSRGAFFLISSFLKGLTYSALKQSGGMGWLDNGLDLWTHQVLCYEHRSAVLITNVALCILVY